MNVRIRAAARLLVEPGAALPAPRLRGQRVAVERMDRLCALSLCAAAQALGEEAAALPPGPESGVLVASAHGCHQSDEAFYRGFLEAEEQLSGASPRHFVYTLPSSPAGELAIHYGLRGPALAEVSGDTAGLQALAEALGLLRRGQARALLLVAAEVSTPTLAALLRPPRPLQEGAAALLLSCEGAEGPVLQRVVTAFEAGRPARALRRALDQAGEAEVLCLGQDTALPEGGLRGAVLREDALYPPGSGAVGALCALSQVLQRGHRSALVLATDARGEAAVARVAQGGGGG